MAEIKTILFRSGLLLWCLLSGTAFGIQKDIDKDVPPQMVKPGSQVQQIVDVNKRHHFTVECTARGDPQPTYQWKRDEQLLDDTQESVKAFENGTLYFENFSDNENGVYQCLATNKYGTSVSVKLPLVNKKMAEKSDQQTSKPHIQDVNEGEPASLDCGETPPTVPKYNKRWYLSEGSTELKATDRVGTDAEGILRFVFAKPEDSRIYTCGLVPSILNPHDEIRMFNSVELKVSPNSELEDVSPQIQFKSENVKALIGKSVTLECFFSGRPVPSITWKRYRNEDIKQDSHRFKIDDFGRKLIITKVEEGDEGTFLCTANNRVNQRTEHITVNVTSPPMKISNQGLSSLVKPDREDITLQCKAKAAKNENLDIPVWYKNGDLLTEANMPERYKFSKDHTELHIQNPDKATDTACFQCNVSNSEGYAFYDGYLKVVESINITRRPEESIAISRDEIIDITVHAVGDSCCTIVKKWSLNGKSLTPEQLEQPPFTWNQTNDILRFDSGSVSNEELTSKLGNYTCRLSNPHDSQEVKFYIYKKVVPIVLPKTAPEETPASGGFELWWVALICGFLAIIIAVIVIIAIVKTNYPKETYPLEKTELKHHLNPKEDLLEPYFLEF